jgi:hypothetical protein
MQRFRPVIWPLATSILALSACSGGDGGTTPTVGPPTAIVSVSGEGQTAIAGADLASPIIVKVTSSTGAVVPNAVVTFSVTSGGGAVASATATTDASGLAQTRWTLGTTTGIGQTVDARVTTTAVPAPGAVTFHATATAGPATSLSKAAPSGDAQTGAVGAALPTPIAVKITDRFGNGVPGVAVAWSVTSGGGTVASTSSTTDDSGTARVTWTLGTVLGPNTASAASGAFPALAFAATAAPGPTSIITLAPNTFNLNAGATQQLTATLKDAFGNNITGRTIAWNSSSTGIATVDANGLVMGVTNGPATITATAESKSGTASVTVIGGTTGAGSPTITSITPATLTPGVAMTINGTNFATTPAGNVIKIDGVTAAATQATATQITLTVPARTSFTCLPSHSAPVSVTVGGLTATASQTLSVATQRALNLGESVAIENGADIGCNEFTRTGGTYFINVANTSPDTTNLIKFTLHGAIGGTQTASVPAAQHITFGTGAANDRPMFPPALLARAQAHRELLEQNRQIAEKYRYARPAGGLNPLGAFAAALPKVGDTLAMKIPNTKGLCNGTTATTNPAHAINARVVYVGTKGIVMEDLTNPLVGKMDSLYRALGSEFDNKQFAILLNNFGNPLAYDMNLNADGHEFMLFSQVVNNEGAGNILGFVSSGDMLDKAICQGSNTAEIFYGYVPTDSSGVYDGWPGPNRKWSPPEWYDYIRSVVIHESKHITANAEHISRNVGPEESWLEEGTAIIAEELYSRTTYNLTQNSNVTYRQSIYCDVRPTNPSCTASREYAMFDVFSFLYDYLESVETVSPLISPSQSGTVYGSAWSLLRWAADQYSGGDEAGFFRAIVQEPQLHGIANLEARTGKPFRIMLSDWGTALAVDDYPGFTATRVELKIPSWNMPDIFTGQNRDYGPSNGNFFPTPSPLATHVVSFGTFTVDVAQLRGGTFATFQVSGPQASPQAYELKGTGAGVPLPTQLRMQIVRVE